MMKQDVKKGQLTIGLHLYSEPDTIFYTTLLLANTVQVSLTYLFQNGSLMSKVVRVLSSTSSMTRLATDTDTSDPIAVPNICWKKRPQKNIGDIDAETHPL